MKWVPLPAHSLYHDAYIHEYVCRFQGYVDAHRPPGVALGLSVAGGHVDMCEFICAVFWRFCAPSGALDVSIYSRWRAFWSRRGGEGPRSSGFARVASLVCLGFSPSSVSRALIAAHSGEYGLMYVIGTMSAKGCISATRVSARRPSVFAAPSRRPLLVANAATLEFIKGIEEPTIPDVKLTRSRDGSSGTATFIFTSPAVFEASSELGDITGLYMNDDEGTIQTVEVQAKFLNGKPSAIEAKLVMRSAFEWERFMRFMERYAEEKELGFQKSD